MKKLLLAATVIVAASTIASLADTRSSKMDITRNLDIFNALVKELQTLYVDSIDAEKSVNTAINAMLNNIDPYTEYIPYKDQEDFMTMTSGEYAGVGSTIMQRDSWVYFTDPMEGSPAKKAGIKAGDKIVMIDNDSTKGWTTPKVSSKLKGPAGTDVRVTVHRPYVEDSVMTFTIRRAKIFQPSVPYYGMLRDGVGYISLTSFIDKSPDEIKDALTALKKEPGLKALVLDLRGNGGGLLESAVKILGYFVPKGTEVLRTRGKGVMNERVYKTSGAPIDTDIPMMVLVDGGTASAAEIISGALQDLDRAVIVGERSFGKGLVQTTRELPYDGMLKVTTAKYYIPSGRLIQAIDYSHRNPDGSVGRIPDSLTSVFHTAGGREVRDGGGITPDVTIDYPDINRVTFNIVRDNWAFDFANRYAARNASIPAPEDFCITDSIYAEFKQFIDPSRFQYDKVCEDGLKALRDIAKQEGYMNDSTKAQFDRLETMLKHDLQHDLDINRKAIEPYLASEIANRYYSTRGEVIQTLKTDPAIDTVITILNDPARYNKILAPIKKNKK